MAESKRRGLSLAVGVFVMLVALPYYAHGQSEIDVDKAVALALETNLSVENARLELLDKKLIAGTVWNRFVPVVTAGATMSRLNVAQQIPGGLIPNPSSAVAPGIYSQVVATPPVELPNWGLGVRVAAQLTLSAQMVYGVRQTVLDYEAGVTSLDQARAQLEQQVRKQFYNLLVLSESIKLQEGAIQTATQRLEQTKINYQNGLVDEFTYLSAQVSLANLRPALDGLRSGYDSALMAFDQTIGLDISARPTLTGTIHVEPLSIRSSDAATLVSKFLDRRYDLIGLHQAAAQLENAIELTRAGLYPTLTLGYSMDPTFLGDPLKDPWFANVQNDWKQVSGAFSITVGLSLDQLLPASQTRVQIDGYRNQLARVRNNLTQARTAAEIEVKNAIATLIKTRGSLEVRSMNVRLAERALQLAEAGYRSGTRDLLDVRSAEQDLQRAQVDRLSDQYDYTVALLDLQAALNTPVSEIRKTIQ